jgi:hypothetical protein
MEYFTDHLQESLFVFNILQVEGEGGTLPMFGKDPFWE